MRLRIHRLLGKLLNWLQLPGFVRDAEMCDGYYGIRVQVKVGWLQTRISVRVRRDDGIEVSDLYFHRLTGAYDGHGREPLRHREQL